MPDVEGPSGSSLSREAILAAMRALSDELGRQAVTGEICLFGGTVMVLAFNARVSTKDVDAIFEPSGLIRELAARVGRDLNLPANWLNDGVKGYVSRTGGKTEGNLPQFPNLRLTMPVPEYLLAMKCMAARLGGTTGEHSDVSDIVFLVGHLQLTSARDVLDLVAQYYPQDRISPRTQFLVEGLFEEGVV